MSVPTTSYGAAIEELVSKQSILDVLHKYCQGCDRSDEAILRDCFHPDAITDHGGMVIKSWEWIPMAFAWLETRVAVTHMILNPMIQVDGDRAISDCHFIAYNRAPKASGEGWEDFIVKGRYLDRFERRDSAWKIARRVGIHDLERTLDMPAGGNDVSGDKFSAKAPHDYFYTLLADFKAGR